MDKNTIVGDVIYTLTRLEHPIYGLTYEIRWYDSSFTESELVCRLDGTIHEQFVLEWFKALVSDDFLDLALESAYESRQYGHIEY